LKEITGANEKGVRERAGLKPSKKSLIFFKGEVFFALTSPLMGDPFIFIQRRILSVVHIENGSSPLLALA